MTGPPPPLPWARLAWVLDPPGHPGRWPGLVIETRQEGKHKLMRVVFGVDELPGRPGAVALERWLLASQIVVAAVAPFGEGGVTPPGRGYGIEASYGANPWALQIIQLAREGKIHRDETPGPRAWVVDGVEGVRGLGDMRDAGVISTPRGQVGEVGTYGKRIIAKWAEFCPLVTPIEEPSSQQ